MVPDDEKWSRKAFWIFLWQAINKILPNFFQLFFYSFKSTLKRKKNMSQFIRKDHVRLIEKIGSYYRYILPKYSPRYSNIKSIRKPFEHFYISNFFSIIQFKFVFRRPNILQIDIL